MTASNPLTSSEHAEAKERAGGGANQFVRLQRAIVKLLFSFRGQDVQLDDRLKRLGLTLKSTPKSVAALTLIDEVVEQVIAADLGRGNVSISARQLADFVGQLQFEAKAVAEGRSMQRRLADTGTREELDRLTRESALFISRQLKPREALVDPATPTRSDEPLSRLLGSLKIDGDLQQTIANLRGRVERARNQSACLDAAEEAAAALSIALATGTQRMPQASIELARQPLVRVLEAVDAASGKDQALDNARAQLSTAADHIELMMAARSLGEALKSQRLSFERELKELGGFLTSITRRVEEFRTNLRHSGYTHEDTIKNSVQMQSTLQARMDHIKVRANEEEHLNHLKIFLTDELIKLEDTFGEHVKAESECHENARSHVVETLRRLAELESEMTQLRSNFDEQQSLSLIDPLTGVYNRLGYIEGVTREYARWTRQGGNLSLAIFDLDLFKSINDQFGHATGDKVLTSVAALLRKHVRGVDLICRYGGEEFVLIMPETNLEGAAILAEKLRGVVDTSQFRFKDTPVPVSMSGGVASFHAEDTIENVFERADRALYRAKKLGRNRNCVEEI